MQILTQQGTKFMPVEAVIEALRQQYIAKRDAGQSEDFLLGFAALARSLKVGVEATTKPSTQGLLRAISARAFGEQKGAGAPFKEGLDAAAQAIFALAGPDASAECAYCRKVFAAKGPEDLTCSKRCRSRYEEGQS